jgi:hypothetical protein
MIVLGFKSTFRKGGAKVMVFGSTFFKGGFIKKNEMKYLKK